MFYHKLLNMIQYLKDKTSSCFYQVPIINLSQDRISLSCTHTLQNCTHTLRWVGFLLNFCLLAQRPLWFMFQSLSWLNKSIYICTLIEQSRIRGVQQEMTAVCILKHCLCLPNSFYSQGKMRAEGSASLSVRSHLSWTRAISVCQLVSSSISHHLC